MPAAWSAKDERQYEHILESCRTGRKKRSLSTCKRIAAATVNKQRRIERRTLSEFDRAPLLNEACEMTYNWDYLEGKELKEAKKLAKEGLVYPEEKVKYLTLTPKGKKKIGAKKCLWSLKGRNPDFAGLPGFLFGAGAGTLMTAGYVGNPAVVRGDLTEREVIDSTYDRASKGVMAAFGLLGASLAVKLLSKVNI
jgi:hypothetical protein